MHPVLAVGHTCGLLRHSAKYFHLPAGYYTLGNIFLLLGLMILNRVKSVEELRRSAPGEWGKILGLDRCPVVETLREKIKLITHSGPAVEQWAAALARDWIQAEGAEQGVGGRLYLVDGPVRVYHGSQTKLPRHYVARQRLCCRATTDYWVNQPEGSPLFKINQAVDPGMLAVLREQIVPRLEAEVPNQPTAEHCRPIPNCVALRWPSIARATVEWPVNKKMEIIAFGNQLWAGLSFGGVVLS